MSKPLLVIIDKTMNEYLLAFFAGLVGSLAVIYGRNETIINSIVYTRFIVIGSLIAICILAIYNLINYLSKNLKQMSVKDILEMIYIVWFFYAVLLIICILFNMLLLIIGIGFIILALFQFILKNKLWYGRLHKTKSIYVKIWGIIFLLIGLALLFI
jgi:hypothetical protein